MAISEIQDGSQEGLSCRTFAASERTVSFTASVSALKRGGGGNVHILCRSNDTLVVVILEAFHDTSHRHCVELAPIKVLLRIIDTSFLNGIDKSKAMAMLAAISVAYHHTPSERG